MRTISQAVACCSLTVRNKPWKNSNLYSKKCAHGMNKVSMSVYNRYVRSSLCDSTNDSHSQAIRERDAIQAQFDRLKDLRVTQSEKTLVEWKKASETRHRRVYALATDTFQTHSNHSQCGRTALSMLSIGFAS